MPDERPTPPIFHTAPPVPRSDDSIRREASVSEGEQEDIRSKTCQRIPFRTLYLHEMFR